MIQNWYRFSKTEAEEQALDFAKRTGLAVVSICPTLVLGPILQSTTVNASSLVLLKLLKGAYLSCTKSFFLQNINLPTVQCLKFLVVLHSNTYFPYITSLAM